VCARVSVSNQLQQWTNFCTNFSPKKWGGLGDASPCRKKWGDAVAPRPRATTPLARSVVWAVAAGACLPPLFGWNDLAASYVVDRLDSAAEDSRCTGSVVYRCVLFRTPSYVLYSASVSFFIPALVTFFISSGPTQPRIHPGSLNRVPA